VQLLLLCSNETHQTKHGDNSLSIYGTMGYYWCVCVVHTSVCDWLLLGDILQRQVVDDPRTVEGIPRLAQGDFFMLPQNFG